MNEWDCKDNTISSVGYLTLYSPSYEGGMDDSVITFEEKDKSFVLSAICRHAQKAQRIMHRSIDVEVDEDNIDEIKLVGLNSNSFKRNPMFHNIFLEWDGHESVHLANFNDLPGMMIKTGRGYHYIEESNLKIHELHKIMVERNCCAGFANCSLARDRAVLRLCPKGENRLEIVRRAISNGMLYDMYEYFVNGLNNEID
jgi:hypothetical protein